MLGSSILGFHTQQHCNNFFESVERYLEARIDREQNAVVRHRRTTLVRPYPISIEWPRPLARRAAVGAPSAEHRCSLSSSWRRTRCSGWASIASTTPRASRSGSWRWSALLERYPELRGRFTFVQLGAPSRTESSATRRSQRSRVAARINERFGRDNYRPIVLWSAHHEPPKVFRFYRAADLCYVSSLHDGMNLVAKEFVAARDDEQGVLVLSHFTGAARELTEALVVNPYDLEEASGALAMALQMPASEQRQRMRAMRGLLSEFNIYRWAGRMLIDAAELRRRERCRTA